MLLPLQGDYALVFLEPKVSLRFALGYVPIALSERAYSPRSTSTGRAFTARSAGNHIPRAMTINIST